MASRTAQRESFDRLPETCPAVESLFSDALLKIEGIMEKLYEKEQAERLKLRDALSDACDDLKELQGQVEALESERDVLQRDLDLANQRIEQLERLTSET